MPTQHLDEAAKMEPMCTPVLKNMALQGMPRREVGTVSAVPVNLDMESSIVGEGGHDKD